MTIERKSAGSPIEGLPPLMKSLVTFASVLTVAQVLAAQAVAEILAKQVQK